MKLSCSNWMNLARGANFPTVWSNVLAAWAINAGAGPSLRWMSEWTETSFLEFNTLGWLLLGSTLIYAGGCFLNDACDHEFDREHRPKRPIPAGDVSVAQAWGLGSLQLGLGAWVMIAGANCSWKWILGLVCCILAYDWVHKKSGWGILLMGGCRSLLWIAAGTAASGMSPAPMVYLWAICVGAYVVGISWYARMESRSPSDQDSDRIANRAPIPFLFVAPLVALGYLILWNNLDPIRTFLANLSGLLAGGIAFLSILKMRERQNDSIGKGVSDLLAGICIVDATALSFHAPLLVGPCILFGGIAHILQKKFAAT